METYYTDKERKFVISAFRELRIALADDLSYPEIRRIEDIIKGGIAAGKAHRDKYGIVGTGRINGTNGMIARRAPRHDCEVSGRCTRLSAAASAHTPMYMDGGVPSPRYIGALCRLMIWDLNTYRSPSPPKPSSPM